MTNKKELIERAQEWIDTHHCIDDYHMRVGLSNADFLLQDFIEALSDQWIPVSERLPESEGRIVLGWIERGPGIEKSQRTACMKDIIWKYITKWQPLPAPPSDVEIIHPLEAAPIEAEAARNFEKAYHELIFAVGNKHKGETRHETALRYIREAETGSTEPAQEANHDSE